MSDKSYATASNEHVNRFKMAHMIGVAEYMRERAPDYMLDPDAMYVVGLLHDIGYLDGREGHEQRGARTLEDLDMDEGVVSAIENHGKNLYELQVEDSKAITPLLVLLIEADMSVDARGYRVGFEGRLADIGRRYNKQRQEVVAVVPEAQQGRCATEDNREHIAYKTVQDNIRFIKEWQKEHGIGKPTALYQGQHDAVGCKPKHGKTELAAVDPKERHDVAQQRSTGGTMPCSKGLHTATKGKGEER